jgi:serine protease Do
MKRWPLILSCFALAFGSGWYVASPLLHGQNAVPQPLRAPAPPVLREPVSFRDVVKKVLPAVVSIEAQVVRPQPRRGDRDEPSPLGLGSGFIVDPKGVVVTNYHVVDGAERVEVTLADGRKFVSKDIKADPKTDLAVVRIESKAALPFLQFGDSDAMEIGDRVLAVGAPFGLTGSVTSGIVSAKSRSLRINMYEDFIQTDAAINPGNSGGPLVNLDGQVIGVNSAIKSKSGGFQGVGLAVASNLVRNIVPALRTTGTVQRGYLGAHIRELDRDVADRLGAPKDGGVVVAEVFDKTPAAKAGLHAGDIITAIGGKTVKDGNTLQRVVASLPIDKAVDVDVVRAGKTQRLAVVIEEQPVDYGVAAGAPAPRNNRPFPNAVPLGALGVDVAELSVDLADDLGYRKGVQGVVITRVHDGSLASLSNLRVGTVISKIDDTGVTTTASAQKAMKATDLTRGVVLQIATPQGGVSYVLVKSLR